MMRSFSFDPRSEPTLSRNIPALLLSACIGLCVLSTLRIHVSQLRHHRAVANNDNPALFIGRKSSPANDGPIGGARAAPRGLSACLLINDENPRLPEWLAYHYSVLPLRSLIVAVDPAGRSSPAEILGRWQRLAGLDVKIWGDSDYLPESDGHGEIRRGACDASGPEGDCLRHHRKRQRYFVKSCMADFKRRNMTWVLLTDVDEYITFNRVRDDDPRLPLAVAPEGVPTLSNWMHAQKTLEDPDTGQVKLEVRIEGTLGGLPEGGRRGRMNGDVATTGLLEMENTDYLLGDRGIAYGNVVLDDRGDEYFLRDDHAFRDAVPMARAPGHVPTLRDSLVDGGILRAAVYDDFYDGKEDGTKVEVRTNWREPPAGGARTLLGGHLMLDARGRTYYAERVRDLWPPHLSPEELMSARGRLPPSGGGATVLDVLEGESARLGDYAKETVGPCLSMPRLLYGSREDGAGHAEAAPDGFLDRDFMTLRYRWHAIAESFANAYQKTIVDVSRLKASNFVGEADNVHMPLKYYCRRDPPRYSASFLRVNHYLDSFEAYSYRNDARPDMRQCRDCYDRKGTEASVARDDDIAPWLEGFVKDVGHEAARELLAGAGDFVRLS